MARIRFSPLVTDASGRIGNLVFSKWKGAPYTRTAALTIDNPQTPRQSLLRGAMAEISKAWNKLLTPEQRANWETFAEQIGSFYNDNRMSEGGQGIIRPAGKLMSGYNAFVRANLERQSIGFLYGDELLLDAPLGIVPPTPPLNVSGFYNPDTGCIHVQYDTPAEPGPIRQVEGPFGDIKEEHPRVRIWLKPLDSYPRIHSVFDIETPLTGAVACVCSYEEYGEEKPIPIGPNYIQLDAVSPYGLRSSPSNLLRVDLPVCCDVGAPYFVGFDIVLPNGNPYPLLKFQWTTESVDGVCRADYVTIFVKDPQGNVFERKVERELWSKLNGVYEYRIEVSALPSGVWKAKMLAGTLCGKVSDYSVEKELIVGGEN